MRQVGVFDGRVGPDGQEQIVVVHQPAVILDEHP